MDKSIFKAKRKNYIALGEIFFWTATINKWQHLLWKDDYKNIIVSSLQYLSDAGIKVSQRNIPTKTFAKPKEQLRFPFFQCGCSRCFKLK